MWVVAYLNPLLTKWRLKMGAYKYIRELWKKDNTLLKQRMVEWRKEPSTVRLERPTRLDRARSLGYKAKGGIIVVRNRVTRKRRKREFPEGGRRPKTFRHRKITNMNYQAIAEQRANTHFKNMEVLNSYYVGEDGKQVWFEVILVDPHHPQIRSDPQLCWMIDQRGRASRGLTSAGRRYRGLRAKGKGAEKMRPSQHAALLRKTN